MSCLTSATNRRPLSLLIFLNIYERCLRFGFDMAREPISVVPTAHYTCGEIVTDLNARSDLDGLHAIGECAFTGLHGANRLASNSLLQCMVVARSAAQDLSNQLQRAVAAPATLPPWDESRVDDPDEQVVDSHKYYSHFRVTNNLLELRNLVLIAELITRCALARHESRGLHFTRDYPQVDPHTAGRDTVLSPPSFEQLDAPANA